MTTGTPPTGGTNGIQVTDGADSAHHSISNLTVTGMLDDGILVSGGSVVHRRGADLLAQRHHHRDAGRHPRHRRRRGGHRPRATAPTPITLANNTAHGILVDTKGSINLTGTVTGDHARARSSPPATPPRASGSSRRRATRAPPQNVITGLVSFGNTGGNGMRTLRGLERQGARQRVPGQLGQRRHHLDVRRRSPRRQQPRATSTWATRPPTVATPSRRRSGRTTTAARASASASRPTAVRSSLSETSSARPTAPRRRPR